MPSPRIEIGCIGLNILVTIREAMRVEHKLVGGKEDGTEGTLRELRSKDSNEDVAEATYLDTLGSGAVVTGRHKLTSASPGRTKG